MFSSSMISSIHFDWTFISNLLSIILIDLLLAGDNAVVIAMAVRLLPQEQRKKGILYGASAAVLLRVIFTFFVAHLLALTYVKLAGGLLILWIAVKLFVEDEEAVEHHREVRSVWHAVRLIVIADITMSLDNMLAVGGASHGDLFLLLLGLGLSIPLIVYASSLLSSLMDKYPVIIWIGAALLGKVGGEMIVTDHALKPFVTPSPVVVHVTEAVFAAGVLVAGRLMLRRDLAKEKAE